MDPLGNDQIKETISDTTDPRICDCDIHQQHKERGEPFPFLFCSAQGIKKGYEIWLWLKKNKDVEMSSGTSKK